MCCPFPVMCPWKIFLSHVILVLSLYDPRYSRYRVTLEIIIIEHIQAKNNLFETGRWKLHSQKWISCPTEKVTTSATTRACPWRHCQRMISEYSGITLNTDGCFCFFHLHASLMYFNTARVPNYLHWVFLCFCICNTCVKIFSWILQITFSVIFFFQQVWLHVFCLCHESFPLIMTRIVNVMSDILYDSLPA